MRELQRRGHVAMAYEPRDAWSRANLLRDHGEPAVQRFHARSCSSGRSSTNKRISTPADFSMEPIVVLVHEWNEPWLIEALVGIVFPPAIMFFFSIPTIEP